MSRGDLKTAGWLAGAAVIVLSSWATGAQTTQPGSASLAPAAQTSQSGAPAAKVLTNPKSAAEPVEIVRRTAGPNKLPTTARSAVQNTPTGGIETGRVVMALGIVIGAIFLMRFIGRRFFPAAAGARASQVIRVLSRSPIAPRQQFLLLQVGRRLIVVGDSGTSMNSLAEITDPDEVAALVSQVVAEKTDSVTKAFGSLFGKARQPFESMSQTDAADRSVDEDDPDAAEHPHPIEALPAGNPADHEAVSYARGELSGLADRIRVLSKQFKS